MSFTVGSTTSGGWSQPGSPTTGFAAYGVQDRIVRSGHQDHRSLFRRRKERGRHTISESEVLKMSDLGKMLDALQESTNSILAKTDDPVERAELLTKNHEEFGAALAELFDASMQVAFQDGAAGSFEKFAAAEQLQKGLGSVASFAMLLQPVERVIKGMGESYGETPVGRDIQGALDAWYEMGKGILRALVEECAGRADELPPEDVAAATEEGMEAAEKSFAEAGEALAKALVRFSNNGRLAKAGGFPPAAGGGAAAAAAPEGVEDPANMDPIEVIGRLAAAITMLADQLLGGGDGDGQVAAAQGAEGGAPPPPAPAAPTGDGQTDKDGAVQRTEDEEAAKAAKAADLQKGDGASRYTGGSGDTIKEVEEAKAATSDLNAETALQNKAEGENEAGDEEAKKKAKAGSDQLEQTGEKSGSGVEHRTEEAGSVAKSDDIAALQKMVGDLTALVKGQNDQMKAQADQIQALREATPAPAKGTLRAIEKTADGTLGKADGTDDLSKAAAAIDAMPESERTQALIKFAQRRPIGV